MGPMCGGWQGVRSAILGVLLAVGTLQADDPAGIPAPGTVRLFNGRDLDGWRPWLVDTGGGDPRNVFTVTNGWLRISGDGLGYLGTTGSHRNYHLVVEFRWGDRNWSWNDRVGRARDSGIFLHARGPDGNSHDGGGAFMAAIECNLFEGAVGDFLLIRGDDRDGSTIEPRIRVPVRPDRDPEGWFWWDERGADAEVRRWGRVNRSGKSSRWRDVTGFRAPGGLEHPAGEWNRVECRCDGDRITVWLNGVRVNSVRSAWPDSGRILLQCEGSEVYFRRIDLRPLEAAGPAAGE